VVNLHGRNTFIALDSLRRTPVDEFFATFKNGEASAQFYYGAGISVLDYADGHFSFGGKDLDISVLTNFVTLAGLRVVLWSFSRRAIATNCTAVYKHGVLDLNMVCWI
jgi:hypothetical protein